MIKEETLTKAIEARCFQLDCDIAEFKAYLKVALTTNPNQSFVVILDGKPLEVSFTDAFVHIETVMCIITLSEYLKLTPRTLNDLGDQFKNEMHMILGVCTEAGEAADAYKKAFAYGAKLDLVNVSEELGGDTMWYISNYFNITGMSLHKAMYANIAKLKARYPEGFSEEKAANRDLDTEREILEKHS